MSYIFAVQTPSPLERVGVRFLHKQLFKPFTYIMTINNRFLINISFVSIGCKYS